jgi:NAD(P)-dependent dehydrogenase (short-subunit alcohol dehydrogenase family)
MESTYMEKLFDLSGRVAVITGGGGVLGRAMASALGRVGVKVAILDIVPAAAESVAEAIRAEGGQAVGLACDVLDKGSIESAAQAVVDAYGHIDILINGAGGNNKGATSTPDLSFFDLPAEAVKWVFDLNIVGTLLPSQVFGKMMAQQRRGVILNISSMNAFRPLTRIPAYSAAKAAVSNFTQWLAVHMNQEYSPDIRVNALAPGFFLTAQNRFLLTEEATGDLTPRGRSILDHTPMGRFGDPEDLVSTMLWLLSDGASFVTGVVVPVDGGFSAFSGV